MKTTYMTSMKTIYILAAFAGLQFNTIFAAANFSESPVVSNEVILGITSAMLLPATPSEATFEDVVELNSTFTDISALTPVIPMIADFNEGAPIADISLIDLAPVTPKEACFEDETGAENVPAIRDLAPVTQVDADFEDHL
jgi:hypothetical protein